MLRVWLPLNEDLRNQGLDDITITNNGATYSATGGKLGGCYSFDGSDDGIRLDGDAIPALQQNDFSICFWTYNNDSGGRSIYIATTPASDWGFSIEKTASEQLRVYWQGNPDYVVSNYLIPVQEWCHITVVIRNGNCYCYKNGEKVAERTNGDMTPAKLSRTWVYAQLGRDTRTGTTVLNGKMNDFRWYDHALSPMEVKKISQGLVLHYRLSGIGGENIVPQTSELTLWTKESNVTCVKDGEWFTITDVGERAARWGIYKNDIAIEPNTDYTFQIECIGNTTVQLCTNSSLASKIQPIANFSGKKTTTFNTAELFGTDAICYMRIYIWPTYSNNHVSKIRNLKIEKGSKLTPWCPNPSDTEYCTMGLDDGIEYDTSGFQNNGTQTGTITWNSDSARYNSCYEMTGTSYINCGKPYRFIPDGSEELTVNIWAYKDTWDTSTQIYSCTESGGFSLSTGNNSISCYCHVYGVSSTLTNSSGETITNSKGDLILLSTSASYITFTQSHTLSSGWHMFTMVYTKEELKLYVDGSLARNMSSSSIGLHYNKNCNLFIGAEATGAGGCSSPYLNGKVSDLRIFATALSDSDILALYNLGGSLDSNGTFHTYEYVEV